MADILERFRLIDLPAEQAARIEHQAGVLVQQKAGSRWRLLVDQQSFPSAQLAQQGLTPLSDATLSLEDLFVALGQSA